MNETVNRKYILILAGVSLLVLTAGALLRPKKREPRQPTPAETASLQGLVRRDNMRDMAEFFADRAMAWGERVIHVPERNASGVIWAPGQILTTSEISSPSISAPVFLMETSSPRTPPKKATASGLGQWALLVARNANQKIVWTAGLLGGSKTGSCRGVTFEQLIVSTPLDAALAGAGAFDLDGSLVGAVGACDGAFQLISSASIPPLLRLLDSPEKKLESRYGILGDPLNDITRKVFQREAGIVVTELRKDGPAEEAGLRIGDVIVSAEGTPTSSNQQLWELFQQASVRPVPLSVLRQGKESRIVLGSALGESSKTFPDPIGISFPPPPAALPEISVSPGTAAFRAGLRSGDQILQIGTRRDPSPADIRRALAELKETPLLIIYQRGAKQNLAVVSK